jgi:hypothetical protein
MTDKYDPRKDFGPPRPEDQIAPVQKAPAVDSIKPGSDEESGEAK